MFVVVVSSSSKCGGGDVCDALGVETSEGSLVRGSLLCS